ncbi:MAG: phosphoribosylglycinamide formyltransferase [Xanthomonadales bacterium]
MRVCVLVSGSGSNLQALIDARDEERIDIDIVRVISNRADARGLERASRAGIPSSILEHQGFADRTEFDHALAELIGASDPDLVVLAGFMRIIGPGVLDPFRGRMINLHPSLLPLYRGTNTYQRALDAGDQEHGASIHFVTGELDGGPVISQVRIPVLAGDDKDSLAARLAPIEHRLVVSTVGFFSQHSVECKNAEVVVDARKLSRPLRLQADDSLS